MYNICKITQDVKIRRCVPIIKFQIYQKSPIIII